MNSSQRRTEQRAFRRKYGYMMVEARMLGAKSILVEAYARRGSRADLNALIERMRNNIK